MCGGNVLVTYECIKRMNPPNKFSNCKLRWCTKIKILLSFVIDLLNKQPEHLVMNQADSYRKTQELRYLIDRTIPTVDYGKGCMWKIFQIIIINQWHYKNLSLVIVYHFSRTKLFLFCLDRVGSEFWKQQEPFGNDLTGIKYVLSSKYRWTRNSVEKIVHWVPLTAIENMQNKKAF